MKASPTTVPIVLTDPEDRLSSHVRHTTLARLTRSQLDALAPFRHELGRMAEHAARVNPEGVDARGELVAVLRDVRQSLLELEKLRTRPFAPPESDVIEIDRPRCVAREASLLLGMLTEWLEVEIHRLPEPPGAEAERITGAADS